MFSLESPHTGDSNEYTQHTINYQFNKDDNHKLFHIIIIMSEAMGFFLGTQKGVCNSRSK